MLEGIGNKNGYDVRREGKTLMTPSASIPLSHLCDDQQWQDACHHQRHAPVKEQGQEVTKPEGGEVLDEQPHHVRDCPLDVSGVSAEQGGQGARVVVLAVKPTNLLAEDSL